MNRRGYVLLMVLGVILIAGLLSTGIARRSIVMTRTAALREAELQRRFAYISTRAAILERAEILLKTEEIRTGAPVGELQRSFLFGNETITVILADEQTKINLNSVARIGQMSAVHRIVTQSETLTSNGVPVLLRPSVTARNESLQNVWFSGWGQVYDLTDTVRRDGYSTQMIDPVQWSRSLTCWGTGELNLRRTPKERVKTLCSLIVNREKVDRLTQMLAQNSSWKTDRLLREIDVSSGERQTLRKYLTDQSRCYSIWFILRDVDRTRCQMAVKTPEETRDVWRQ